VRRGAQSGGSALPGLITEKLAVVVDFMVNYLSARWKMASGRCQLPTTTGDLRLFKCLSSRSGLSRGLPGAGDLPRQIYGWHLKVYV